MQLVFILFKFDNLNKGVLGFSRKTSPYQPDVIRKTPISAPRENPFGFSGQNMLEPRRDLEITYM